VNKCDIKTFIYLRSIPNNYSAADIDGNTNYINAIYELKQIFGQSQKIIDP